MKPADMLRADQLDIQAKYVDGDVRSLLDKIEGGLNTALVDNPFKNSYTITLKDLADNPPVITERLLEILRDLGYVAEVEVLKNKKDYQLTISW